jgi:hypothetical protein
VSKRIADLPLDGDTGCSVPMHHAYYAASEDESTSRDRRVLRYHYPDIMGIPVVGGFSYHYPVRKQQVFRDWVVLRIEISKT